MPPDVFLVLASSGLTLVASLMFFVHPETAPVEVPGPQLGYCLPPAKAAKVPPPLPVSQECTVPMTPGCVMTLRAVGDEWVMTLNVAPLSDVPALRIDADGQPLGGAVHDLRLYGRAGVPKAGRRVWKQKPAQA